MQSTINNRQMVFILFIVITATQMTTIAKTMALSAGHGAWITLLLASILMGFFAAIIVKLNKMYEGRTLFEYSREIAGKWMPYLLCVFYLGYFLIISMYYCISFENVVHSSFLLKTPKWVLILVGMPVYGVIAYKGFTNAGRLAEIVGLIFLIISTTLLITMLIQGRINYILPLYIPSEIGKNVASLKDAVVPMIGFEVLTIIPFIKDHKPSSKVAFFSLVGIGLFYILTVYGCYAMIGMDEIVYLNNPLIDGIRLVEYSKIEFLQRVDVVYQTIGFIRVFVGKSIIYLVIVEYLGRLFPKVRRIVIVVCTGIIIYAASTGFMGIPQASNILVKILTYAAVFAILIPTTLFLIAKVKKNVQKSR